MRGRYAWAGLVSLLTLSTASNAQVLTPEIARTLLTDPDTAAIVSLGDCALASLRDGTKIELADAAVDTVGAKCDRQLRAYFGHSTGTQAPADETSKIIAGFRAHPEMARAVIVGAAIHTFQLRQAANAGGQPAASTAGSK